MWRSLVERRNSITLSPTPAPLQQSVSNASTINLTPTSGLPTSLSQGVYEVTRYTFKHTISRKKDGDHDYCWETEWTYLELLNWYWEEIMQS